MSCGGTAGLGGLRGLALLRKLPPFLNPTCLSGPPHAAPTLPPTTHGSAPDWTKIAQCRPGSTDRLLGRTANEIMRMAERSTRIKTCAGDLTADEDCAISAAGSFPLLMLQKGRTISHNGDKGCGQSCVKTAWTGGSAAWKATKLWSNGREASDCQCSANQHGLTGQNRGLLFHACGNAAGFHFGVRDTDRCDRGATGGMQIFIDYHNGACMRVRVRACAAFPPLSLSLSLSLSLGELRCAFLFSGCVCARARVSLSLTHTHTLSLSLCVCVCVCVCVCARCMLRR